MLDIPKESFLFIRHGKTNWSYADITRGPSDLDLNEMGRKEADAAGNILVSKGECYTIFSSPLKRAIETAKIVNIYCKGAITILDDLQERYHGDFSLLSETISDVLPSDAESDPDFSDRIFRVIDKILNSPIPSSKKVIVSHGLVFRQISLILTGKEERIGYGEVFLFIPPESSANWQLSKLDIT